ncbi:Nop domain [Dillenia turbinata]|uniref:Nop domain n=1 Tax=Dillenia turbinata TaxID=194707 RepID=A0AAN8VNU4_9MAGN
MAYGSATLADSFLADLEELSDDEADLLDEDDMDASKMEEDVDGDMGHMEDIEAFNYDDLDNVSKLQKSQRYIDIMKKVEDALQRGSDVSNMGIVLEDDPEYQFIVDCNALLVDIENEIAIIHNFIRDKYRLKFPELESLVHHPIDYARVVKKIGNEMDLTLVDLEGLLPSAIIMVVSVMASTTSSKPLSEENLQKTIDACDRALALDLQRKRMGHIAPNLSAAKLMGTASGLTALAKMPACNVQLLSAKKKTLAGFSTATSQFRVGYLELTEIFQSTPPSLRMHACRLMAAKYATTDMRKLANGMQFGVPEESSLGDGLGEGYGMLGQAGSGKLLVSVGPSKLAAKVAKKHTPACDSTEMSRRVVAKKVLPTMKIVVEKRPCSQATEFPT